MLSSCAICTVSALPSRQNSRRFQFQPVPFLSEKSTSGLRETPWHSQTTMKICDEKNNPIQDYIVSTIAPLAAACTPQPLSG
ncbi:hypothetical protein VTJ04DRAFT_7791 [Mycothermus thermophilus]|uniref:uncharacterized protein n=1 Tax=Humicola insolens TaxID=85995 RepID=UPI003743EA23